LIDKRKLCVAVLPKLSVTLTVKLNAPLAVGLPLLTPDAFSQKGAPLIDQLYGAKPPQTDKVWL
jgi:hypothetical protein